MEYQRVEATGVMGRIAGAVAQALPWWATMILSRGSRRSRSGDEGQHAHHCADCGRVIMCFLENCKHDEILCSYCHEKSKRVDGFSQTWKLPPEKRYFLPENRPCRKESFAVWGLVIMFSFLQYAPVGWAGTLPLDTPPGSSVSAATDALKTSVVPNEKVFSSKVPSPKGKIVSSDTTVFTMMDEKPLSTTAFASLKRAVHAAGNELRSIFSGTKSSTNFGRLTFIVATL